MKKIEQERGITLIALVITIIVLLILAGVTLNLTLGEKGIFQTAQQAVKNYTNAQDRETAELNEFTNMLNKEIHKIETGINDDIYVSLNGKTLSFYDNEQDARSNADSEEHYYGNIKGKRFYDSTTPWNSSKDTIEEVVIVNKIYPTNTQFYFRGLTALKEIKNLNRMDTSNVVSMQNMFENCSSLTSLDVSTFDTSNVRNMQSMFYGCSNLTNLDVSKFDTSNVTTFDGMFVDCKEITNLDVSNFNTSKATTIQSMFYGCSNLTNLDLSNFDTSNVRYMAGMFYRCKNINEINVSNFNTSKVISMRSMFYECSKLNSINISNFSTAQVKDMVGMFYATKNVTSILVGPNWTTENANTENMFLGCGVQEVTVKQ